MHPYLGLALLLLRDMLDHINLNYGMWWVAWAGVICGLHVGGRFLRGRRSRD